MKEFLTTNTDYSIPRDDRIKLLYFRDSKPLFQTIKPLHPSQFHSFYEYTTNRPVPTNSRTPVPFADGRMTGTIYYNPTTQPNIAYINLTPTVTIHHFNRSASNHAYTHISTVSRDTLDKAFSNPLEQYQLKPSQHAQLTPMSFLTALQQPDEFDLTTTID